MTLIISCLTSEYIVQVCDRRLTMPDGSIENDDATKAVMYVEALTVFAYTGLAKLPQSRAVRQLWPNLPGGFVPTDQWLASVLALADDEQGLARETASALQRASYRVPDPVQRRVGFIGVYWQPIAPGGDDEPGLITVSNLDDPSKLTVEHVQLEGRTAAVYMSLPLPRVRARLERDVRNCMRREAKPAAVGRLLAGAVRQVADRIDIDTVGKGLLVNCIPLNAVKAARAGNSFTITASEPTLDGATFFYMPEDGDDFVQHPPALVLPRGNVFVNASFSGARGSEVVRIG